MFFFQSHHLRFLLKARGHSHSSIVMCFMMTLEKAFLWNMLKIEWDGSDRYLGDTYHQNLFVHSLRTLIGRPFRFPYVAEAHIL